MCIIRWSVGCTFDGTHFASHSILLSSLQENLGMKPSERLLVAVAARSSFEVVSILEK